MRFRWAIASNNTFLHICRKYCQGTGGRDPAAFFFNGRVQNVLFQLNDRQHDQVFKPRKLGQKLEAPQYLFMTEEDITKEQHRISSGLREKLQVPPVLNARKPVECTLATDPGLVGLYDSKLVCIDISPDLSDRKRMVCVRETDGTLRTANWDERSRMCQIFIPVEGRSVTTPMMFTEPHLKACLDREDYTLVLDRACLQFEPDDPDYIRVTSATYDHVDGTRLYDRLQNTRHFGALAFYLAWHRRIDNLLLHFIQLEKLDKAVHLIALFRLLRSTEPISEEATPSQQTGSQSVSESTSDSDSSSDSDQDAEEANIDAIREYIETASVKRAVLELALQQYQQVVRGRRERAPLRADAGH
ncbi:28S ribosomal protein S22, mitochondrial-like [Pollicipes pollicipes]|uniref:28S ribosomal protein S22, mitochondrial-like n=1 Tax=Pollicipes pollicipes TaxID=41117 RepID=UPI0018854161|nr:28S ribosomal protein S22, mitochondrial-like [Pollicipes pollicipes]